MKRMSALFVLAFFVFCGVARAQDPVKVFVFTAEPAPGAFADAGISGRRDSVKDLEKEFNKGRHSKTIQVADTRKDAAVTIEVTDRQEVHTVIRIEFVLRSGSYSMPYYVQGAGAGSSAAIEISKIVEKWIKENRAAIRVASQ